MQSLFIFFTRSSSTSSLYSYTKTQKSKSKNSTNIHLLHYISTPILLFSPSFSKSYKKKLIFNLQLAIFTLFPFPFSIFHLQLHHYHHHLTSTPTKSKIIQSAPTKSCAALLQNLHSKATVFIPNSK